MKSFLPFVAFGFIAWQFISQLVLDGCTVFIANGPIIQQLRRRSASTSTRRCGGTSSSSPITC